MDYSAYTLKKQYEKACKEQRIKNLKRLREEIAKLSQTEFCKQTGFQKSNLSKLENGDRDLSLFNIQVYKTYFLEKYDLNISTDYLLGYTNVISNESMDISNDLGISGDSISKLKKYTSIQGKIVDKLLSTGAMDKIIDSYIYLNLRFFHKVKIEDTIFGERQASDDESDNFHFFQSTEMLKTALNIINSDKELSDEFSNTHAKEKGIEFWKTVVNTMTEQKGIDEVVSILSQSENAPKYVIDYAKSIQKDKK